MFARQTNSTFQAQNRPVGRHFQGGSFACVTQGLKPWAMVYNRFAVNPTGSWVVSVGPFHGQEPRQP